SGVAGCGADRGGGDWETAGRSGVILLQDARSATGVGHRKLLADSNCRGILNFAMSGNGTRALGCGVVVDAVVGA
ncbi:MAG: hypothetical protein WAM13_14930, partial [Candidatus Sulfotelmatobacter sp.]